MFPDVANEQHLCHETTRLQCAEKDVPATPPVLPALMDGRFQWMTRSEHLDGVFMK
jgi:hypothetical protein